MSVIFEKRSLKCLTPLDGISPFVFQESFCILDLSLGVLSLLCKVAGNVLRLDAQYVP